MAHRLNGASIRPKQCDEGAKLKAEMQAFLKQVGTANVHSEADLIRQAVRYYMRDYRRAWGRVDSNGFPAGSMAIEEAT